MKSSKAQTERRFHKIPHLVFETTGRLTFFAGLVVLQALFAAIGLRPGVQACFREEGQKIYGFAKLFLLIVVHVLLGFRRIDDVRYYRTDPLVKRLVGLRTIPSGPTLCRFLQEVTAVHVERLRRLLRRLVSARLLRERLPRLTLDFDGSTQTTKGHREGTAVGFNKTKKGARSYYALFCTIAQTGQFFDFHHRPGNVHDSNGAPEFMDACFREVRAQQHRAVIESRQDSAFFNQEVVAVNRQNGVEFTATVPFQRFPELKVMIQAQDTWERIDDVYSSFECEWKPKSWTEDCVRLVLVRQCRRVQQKGPLQLDLFEPVDFVYEYQVIATNKTGSAKAVVYFHHGRGSQEKIFGESKQHAALEVLPSHWLHGNQVFTLAAMMAHNLGRELQMWLTTPLRRAQPKRPTCWRFSSLRTLRRRLFCRAGLFTWPQKHLTLSIEAEPSVQAEFLSYMTALGHGQPAEKVAPAPASAPLDDKAAVARRAA